MSEEIKMAVIGLGNFGALHARTLAGLPQARLVGLVDQRVDHAEKMAGQLGVSHSSGSLEALCKQTEVDAVVIATRTDTHVQIALQAIEAGLHVLVEKQAGSPHEIQNMIQPNHKQLKIMKRLKLKSLQQPMQCLPMNSPLP